FKILYQVDYKLEALIAVGAEAITNGFMNAFGFKSTNEFVRIMCLAHVHRDVEQRTKSLDNSKQIRADIDLLQISPNTKFFELAFNLF
ncbi:unnamed protein product, partial [Brachionus calyciflorus]